MDEFNRLKAEKAEYERKREENYRNDSKVRLTNILKKKIQTTMIGALSSIEDHFKFLWESDKSVTQEQMYDLFQKVRSEILDKGNTQARNLEAELNQYDVKWLRYNVTIPVKSIKEGN